MHAIFWILTLLVFCFTYVNGFRDGCNVVATLIASRSMKPAPALLFASIVELFSPFTVLIIGSSVSGTIQKLIDPAAYTASHAQTIGLLFLSSGLIAAIIWNLSTWFFAIPSSSSHALIGGVVGAGIMAFGWQSVSWGYFWTRVVLMIFLTPLLSFAVGWLVMKALLRLGRSMSSRAAPFFRYAQYVNMVFLAFNHSFNDSQKSTGILMILIGICFGASPEQIPLWAIGSAAFALALGILTGGLKVIKTVGTGIYRVRPIHSFTSQLSSGLVILGASVIGAPVSASQIVSSSIIGVGAAERYKGVKWNVAGKILISWIITVPIAGAIGAVLLAVLRLIFL